MCFEKSDRQAALAVIGLLMSLIMAVSCGSSQSDASGSSIDGQYVVSWIRSAVSCSPQPLPAPLLGDTSQYAAVSLSRDSLQTSAAVALTGAFVSIVPGSSSGGSLSSLALSGPIDPPSLLGAVSRTVSRTEGPRAGSHTFFVVESAEDSVWFTPAPELPPGNRIEVNFTAHGTGSALFRDGSPSGSVFTTCTFLDTLVGTKVADAH